MLQDISVSSSGDDHWEEDEDTRAPVKVMRASNFMATVEKFKAAKCKEILNESLAIWNKINQKPKRASKRVKVEEEEEVTVASAVESDF